MNAINLSGKREVFWDDYLVDREHTTALHVLHNPVEANISLVHDKPWEGNACGYHNIIVEPDGLMRMYYTAYGLDFEGKKLNPPISFCYAESRDGITWDCPKLDVCDEWDGIKTNIIIDGRKFGELDGMRVIRDENPNCPIEERYKAVGRLNKAGGPQLWCWISADGLHFTEGWLMSDKGNFDTMNNPIWDPELKIYHCYLRSDHYGEWCRNEGIRDIRYMWSKNFREWSDPVILDFMGKEDYPLYTNCISVYERASQIMIGFPTRYVDRYDWSHNYERLCGLGARKHRMTMKDRMGTAITDCIFMFSRDPKIWCRYDEAFVRPGPENPDNWVYGDAYPTLGLVETPSKWGSESEFSLYIPNGKFSENRPMSLVRYTIRKDGFVSLNAPYDGAVVTTKPFIFDGKGISVNFSTSARGYLYIKLTAHDGTVADSCEIFGDSCDRVIDFDKDLSCFAGKETVMEIRMRDADVYSVKFD